MLSSSSSSSALAATASLALALRRASGAAAGVSNGSEIASALAGSLLPAAARGGWPPKSSLTLSPSFSSRSTSSAASHAPPPLPPSARADFAYCADLVRKSDPENYLWAMELPKGPQRAVALALRAFNVETATAADAASAHSRKEGVPSSSNSSFSSADHQAALASARLLWWKEAAAEAAASASGNGTPAANHPVARALAAVAASRAVAPRSLSARLSRVAAARADDATGRAVPGTINDLESYGEATAAQLLYLQLEAQTAATGTKGSADADHAASHLGRAAAITSLLRGMRSHAAARRCYLPSSELESAGTSAQELFRVVAARAGARAGAESGGSPPLDAAALLDFPDPLREATRAVASAALAHLSAARGLAGRLPPGASACLLQSVNVAKYLSLLERTGFDPLAAEEFALGSAAARARHRAALAVETRWRSWRGTY
jgi:NADH dehydrogenase [ubiquinone] 1 alpha subcomplex assembly factor 6